MGGFKVAAGALLASALGTGPVIAQDYLCSNDHLAGYTWNKAAKKWAGRELKGNIRFVLKKNAEKLGPPGTSWIVSRVGKLGVAYWCPDTLAYGDSLICNSNEGDFRVNLKTLRFMEANYSTYIDDGTTDFTPTLAIGECTRL